MRVFDDDDVDVVDGVDDGSLAGFFSFLIIMCECVTFYMMPNSVGR